MLHPTAQPLFTNYYNPVAGELTISDTYSDVTCGVWKDKRSRIAIFIDGNNPVSIASLDCAENT